MSSRCIRSSIFSTFRKLKSHGINFPSTVTPDGGGFRVLLSFNDDAGEPLWRMELTVPDEEKAKALVKRFQDAPEKLYGELIALLFPENEQ